MSRVTPQALAARSGVEERYVERLIDLGLIDIDEAGRVSERSVRRIRIVRGLERSGLPLQRLSEAVKAGSISLDFIETPTYDRWVSLTDVTFEQLSSRTGVPVELLTVIREAMGFAKPDPSERVREDEMSVVPLVQMQHERGFNPTIIERALRVSGESMRRVAETESDWWRSEVMMPIYRAGGSAADMAETSIELSPRLASVGDRAIMAIYHGQQTNAWMRNLLEGFEAALEASGIYEPAERVPAMCFLDLTGYTRLTEERGDAAAADLARVLATLVQQLATRHGGTAVKWLGDGVMFHFPDPGKGVLAALDMVDAVHGSGLPPAHVGLHAGPVLFQEGDYFGRTVNIASRIAEQAGPGEVLVSRKVVEAAEGEPVSFVAVGPVELKGLSGALDLFRAGRGG